MADNKEIIRNNIFLWGRNFILSQVVLHKPIRITMEKEMSDLEKYFINNEKRLINKWKHYFDIYDHHFNRFRGRECVILEIGVFQGGSLQMWKYYFGEHAKIYGIDVNPMCKRLEEEKIQIFIGSQTDRKFLRQIKLMIPPIDILIDDGGHTMSQQKVSFKELFSHIKSDGVYLCEDLHTSYQVKYGGGYKRMGTFIEYSKNFIDYLNAYHSEQKCLKVNSFTESVDSVHYYDSVIVIEKRLKEKPFQLKTGHLSFPDEITDNNYFNHLVNVSRRRSLKIINWTLRFFRLPGFMWK